MPHLPGYWSLTLLLLLTACEVDNYDPDRRYFTGAEVRSLPQLNYDPDNSPPDLRLDLKRRSAGFWEFSTHTIDNAANLPVFLSFPAEILATDEIYEIRLVDEDPNEPQDDEIFFWDFHATEDGDNGRIRFRDSGRIILELNFNLK